MTSSLVGSEMCIRDSNHTTKQWCAWHCGNCITAGGMHRKSTCAAYLHQPVSYTHLTLPTICSV
eukprot:10795315-Prorocentrum_lima.AAC.1